MAVEQESLGYGRELATWTMPMYQKYQRGPWWYAGFFVITATLVLLSFLTPNFLFDKPNYLFAIIVLLSVFVFITSNFKSPPQVEVSITTDGLLLDDRFYSYETFRNFCVLYKPNTEVKALYFEFQNPIRPRLSLTLSEQNPLALRDILRRYLPEDLERTDEPNTDFLAKKLKL